MRIFYRQTSSSAEEGDCEYLESAQADAEEHPDRLVPAIIEADVTEEGLTIIRALHVPLEGEWVPCLPWLTSADAKRIADELTASVVSNAAEPDEHLLALAAKFTELVYGGCADSGIVDDELSSTSTEDPT